MKNLYMMFSLILLIGIVTSCSEQKPTTQAAGKLMVFAGIPPVSNIAEIIGGQDVAVKTLLPPGQSPHSFTPRPGLIKQLGQAKLYISVNLPFEQHIIVPLLKSKAITVCYADMGITKHSMSEHLYKHNHALGQPHDEHKATATRPVAKLVNPDPHVWLSTANDLIIAKNITAALCKVDPVHAATYHRNLAGFTKKLAKVKHELEQLLAPYKGQTLYVYHPAFGYFAAEFGLKQEAVELGGKQPTPKQLAILIKNAKQDKVKFIFVQPRFSERSAEIIANQIGAQVIRLNPLSHDLLDNYLKIAKNIKKSMIKR